MVKTKNKQTNKKPACQWGRCNSGSIPGWRSFPGGMSGNPPQNSPSGLWGNEVMLSHELFLNLTSIYKILTDSHLHASEYTYCNTFLRAGFCFKTNRCWGGKYFQKLFFFKVGGKKHRETNAWTCLLNWNMPKKYLLFHQSWGSLITFSRSGKNQW